MTEVAHYSFVPWLRRGLAAGIAAPDTLGDAPGDDGGRAQLSAELALTQVPLTDGTAPAPAAIRKSIELLGPGDVGAIAPQAILRTEPYAGAADATPGELAYVEFYEEDFPWRYTPARAANQVEDPARRHKLRPWIALWVLEEDELELLERAGAPPVLALRPGADLPPAGETWAWAHVQLSQVVADPAQVGSAIQARPDHALSRLLCPRRLEAGRHYHAVLVPAFETGRLAGLGLPTAGVPTQQASWGTAAAQADPRYPVYLHWSFSTGFLGSFEELVRALVARPVGEAFGKRPLDVRDPGYGLDRGGGPDTVGLEGALQPPRFVRDPFPDVPGPAFVAGLEEVVDLSENLTTPGSEVPDDPIVTPPAYGRWHAGLARVADAADDPDVAWLRELNLDPRARAAGGLGTEVVRQRQEELMERAWKQVGRLEDANQRLREAELATAAGDALYAKHLLTATAERMLILTSAAQTGLGAAGRRITVRGAVDESRVPAAAQSAAFRRLTRPQRKLLRQVTGRADVGGLQDGLISGMNADPAEAITTAPPPPEPPAAVSLAAV
jgi:hypothetical protein